MTIEQGKVEYHIKDSVAWVCFGHPKGNSLPGQVLKTLAKTIDQVSKDASCKVIVLTSSGAAAFCAGASFEELKAIADKSSGKEFFSGFAHVILSMIRSPKFVISRVQGKSVGGGVGLIAASDYSLALNSAAIRLSELAIGIGPFVVGPCVEKKLGAARFSALALDANWRDATWAYQAGLYTQIFENIESLDHALLELAQKLAGFSSEAMRELKKTFWQDTSHWEKLLIERAEISGTLVLSAEAKQAIQG